MGEPLEVVVKNAVYITHLVEQLQCLNKPHGSCVPGFCIRTKDATGNTYTLDITHDVMSALKKDHQELSYNTACSLSSRLNGRQIQIDLDEMIVVNLDRYIPKKRGLLRFNSATR
jgi:hypothetical protein